MISFHDPCPYGNEDCPICSKKRGEIDMPDNTNKEIEDRWNDFCENQVWGCDGSTLIVIGDFWKNEVTKSHQSGIEEGKRQERERILDLPQLKVETPYWANMPSGVARNELRYKLRKAISKEEK